jgi:chromosome segregation protein
LQAEQEQIRASGERATNQLREATEEVQRLRERERELVAADDRGRQQLQDEQGRLMSLQALQQAALGLAQGKVTEWLSSNSLAERPRLAQQLVVEPGWERAVETVLGSYLEAVSVDTIDAIANRLESLQVGAVSFFSSGGTSAQVVDGGRLLARVQGPAAISALLTGIIAVDTLPEALDKRRTLLSGESVITRDGVWIGRDWLRVSRDKDVHAGVIGREKEMRSLRSPNRTRNRATGCRRPRDPTCRRHRARPCRPLRRAAARVLRAKDRSPRLRARALRRSGTLPDPVSGGRTRSARCHEP